MSKLLRIGYLTYGLDREPTGIGRYALELLRALGDLSVVKVVVLATETEDRYGLHKQFAYQQLPGCRLLPVTLTLGNALLGPLSRLHQLDIIHDPNGIAPFLGASGGVRRVITIHDTFAYTTPETHNWLDNWRFRWHLPAAARRADAVITVSEQSRGDLLRYLRLSEQRVHVIGEGVDPRFRPLSEPVQREQVLQKYGVRPPYLLYVGGINPRKNIVRLLEAFARLRPSYPALTLVIGGKRQWRTAEIAAAVKRDDIASELHFTGYVADADLPALYSGAEAFVFPSLHEGFGLPPLEAMACGTPVITSNVSALPEVVGAAALTVDPCDVGALTTAMVRVLDDQALRMTLIRRGIDRAAKFTWRQAALQTLELYQMLVADPKSAALSIRSRHM
ncbi:MAG: glycosyltransferase family 4 protein [Chloroflexales bacterium]|nr:glycosyltransferase family 4 protein [Chloroflexales bacterium]